MKFKAHIQNPCQYPDVPNQFLIQRWLNTVLQPLRDSAELTLRIVDPNESQQLNHQYRKKNKPTNVLSFPMELPDGLKQEINIPMIGDLVICHDIVYQEAQQQHKTLEAHYAHMIIHGVLHLLGYDHIKEEDADIMEPLEISTLAKLGFKNPYEPHNDTINP